MQHKELADQMVAIAKNILAAGGTKADIDAALKPLAEKYPTKVLQAARLQIIADGLAG